MTLPQPALACLLAALATTGCGQTSTSSPARTRKIPLDWHEASRPPGSRLIVDVRGLEVRPGGWTVTAAVRNDTRVTLAIGRPHHPGQTEFGLLVLPSASVRAVDDAGPGVFASSFTPAIPRALHPQDAWSGTFSGRGRLAEGHYVRVELGRFTTVGPPRHGVPWRFRYITDHVVRLR